MFTKSVFAIERDVLLGILAETLVFLFFCLLVLVFSIVFVWWHSI